MKLRKRIAAAFTALALMCTFTDPAALGGAFNAVGSAFAANSDITMLGLSSQLPKINDLANQGTLSSSCFNTGTEYVSDNPQVDWFEGTPSYDSSSGDPIVPDQGQRITKFGFNKSYYAVAYYTPINGYTANPDKEISFQYFFEGETGNKLYAPTWVNSATNTICALFDMGMTRKADANDAKFVGIDGLSSDGHTVSITIPSHSDLDYIFNQLPKTATIYTEDPALFFGGSQVAWKPNNNFVYTGTTYDSSNVTGMEFELVGTVKIADSASSRSQVSDSTVNNEYKLYAHFTVSPAHKVSAPVFDTEEGDYSNSLSVKLKSPPQGEDGVTYYYLVDTDKEALDKTEIPLVDDNKYVSNRGIQLAGVTNKKITYYVKVVGYHPDMQISDYYIGSFTILLRSSSATNIPEVHISVDPPVGGSALDVTAELDKKNGTYDEEVLQISSFGSVIWSEPGQSDSALAKYNTVYTMSVEVTPASPYYAFMRTPDVYVNGVRATGSNTGNGNFTITFSFERTGKLTDYATVSPGKVANVPSGTTVTEMESSYLPKTVKVVGTKDSRISEDCAVTWDLTSAVNEAGEAYSPKIGKAQTVTITGKVKLPDYMQEDASKTSVTARIYVEDASKVPVPWAKPEDTIEGEGTTVFNSPQEITLATSVNSAMIYYTIEAFENLSDIKLADPTEAGGTKYLEPILLSGEPGKSLYYCIKAIAIAPGMRQSDVATFIYKVVIERKKAEIPTANPLPGNYDHSLKVKLNTETPNGKIYYTLDPNASKGKFVEYTGAIAMDVETNSSKTFKLRCYTKAPDDSLKDSDISEVMVYNITVPMEKAKVPVPDREEGISEDTIKIKLTCETAKADIYYSLDRPIIRGQYEGKKYKTGSSITLKRVDNEVVVYKLYTYAKSTDPDNLADSDIKVYYYTVGKDYGVKMIEVAKRPSKYSYYMGEKLNVTGGLIKVTYEDTSKQSETIYMTESMIQDFDSWVLGQQTLTVYYMGCTTAFNIIVRKRSSSSGTDNPKPPADDDKKDDSKTDDTKDDTTDDNTDNSDDTVSDPTMQGSQVKGWTQLQKKIASAAKNSRVVIYLNGNTSVPADIINTARKKNITLEFVINDMLSWVIDTGALKKNVASVSVGVKSKDVYIPSVLIDGAGEKEIVRMHTYGANKIGAVLYVKTGSKVNNRFANLYVYNGDSHQLEFRDTSKVVASSGLAQVVPAEGGDYVLMLDTSTRLPGDADNSTTIDARDASAILKMCVGMMELDDSCDYNQDGFVNALDSAAILRSVVGLSK